VQSFVAVDHAVCVYSVRWICKKMGPGVQLNVTRGHRKAVQSTPYRLLLVMYGNYGPILYGLRDMCNLVENRSFFRIPRVFKSSLGLLSSEIRTPNYSAQKTTMIGLRDGEKKLW